MTNNSSSSVNSEMEMTPNADLTPSGSENCATSENGLPKLPTEIGTGDLSVVQAAALLTADILGTGLLALPENVAVLGPLVGLSFLVANLPINWYAGHLLSRAADGVDRDKTRITATAENTIVDDANASDFLESATAVGPDATSDQQRRVGLKRQRYNHIATNDERNNCSQEQENSEWENPETPLEQPRTAQVEDEEEGEGIFRTHSPAENNITSNNSTANDLIDLTQDIFGSHGWALRLVMLTFYINVFLVLGDYILVMAHAVSAIFDDDICFPHAGIIACILMFGLTQVRRMGDLGRWATIISLGSLVIVVLQCLVAAQQHGSLQEAQPLSVDETTPLRKLSALASIGFATGSNKLLLNVRHEMKDRTKAPQTLGLSMGVFGAVYVSIVLLAGSNPPGFLFNSIPPRTTSRRIAGVFLWIHIAVSYAINSQAICASLDDRMFQQQTSRVSSRLASNPRLRWLILTGTLAVSSYLVANAVPFFKDLVALIGALTSIPLALLIPVLQHRRYWQYPLWWPTKTSLASYGLVVFGLVYLATGLVGAVGSIELDWENQGEPFSCAAT